MVTFWCAMALMGDILFAKMQPVPSQGQPNVRQTPALRKQAAAESCELTPHIQGMSSQWSPSGVPWL